MPKDKRNSLKRKKTSNPDSCMILILELTDREIKITMTNMLRDFMQKKIDNMQEQMVNVSKEM